MALYLVFPWIYLQLGVGGTREECGEPGLGRRAGAHDRVEQLGVDGPGGGDHGASQLLLAAAGLVLGWRRRGRRQVRRGGAQADRAANIALQYPLNILQPLYSPA